MTRDTLQLRLGRVVAALSATNHYSVDIIGYGKATAVSAGTGGDSRSGHRSAESFAPGTMVVVADPTTVGNEDANEWLPFALLCAVPFLENAAVESSEGEVKDTDFMKRSIDLLAGLGFSKNEIIQTFVQSDVDSLLQDRGSNYPDDLVAGSWAKTTAGGGIAMLSNMLARFGISPSCYVQYFYPEGRMQFNADELETNTNTRYSWEGFRGTRSIRHGYESADLREAAGSLGKAPAYTEEEETGLLVPAEERATPLPRRTDLGGGYFDGEWRVTAAKQPEDDEDSGGGAAQIAVTDSTVFQNASDGEEDSGGDTENYHIVGESPLMAMTSTEDRYDGVLSMKAARELRLEKTTLAPVPEMWNDVRHSERAEDVEGPDEPIWEELGFESEDEFRALRHLLPNELDRGEFERLRKGFRTDLENGIWIVHIPDFESESLPRLDAGAMEYSLEDVPTEDVETTEGRTVKVFKNSSSFVMTDEGGIVIGDGFGSEIRMHRGNIYFTCPGDEKHLPGRDLFELVPRKIIRKSGKLQEMTSSEGAIVMKAETDMKLLSGNGGSGGMVIENKAEAVDKAAIKEDAQRAGSPIGAGITLISGKAGVAAFCKSLYVGGLSEEIANDVGSDALCDIVLNSGPGSVFLQGSAIDIFARNTVGLGLTSGDSLMYLSNSQILQVCSGNVTVAANALSLDEVSISANIPEIDSSGVGKTNNQRVEAGPPALISQGDMLMRGNMAIEGSMAIVNISSKDGINGQLALQGQQRRQFDIALKVPTTEVKTLSAFARTWLKGAVDRLAISLVENPHTGLGQNIMGVAMPVSNSTVYAATAFTITAARWQTMLTDYGTWRENIVDHAILGKTSPYPGQGVYDGSEVYQSYDKENEEVKWSPLSEYRTNTSIGESDGDTPNQATI